MKFHHFSPLEKILPTLMGVKRNFKAMGAGRRCQGGLSPWILKSDIFL